MNKQKKSKNNWKKENYERKMLNREKQKGKKLRQTKFQAIKKYKQKQKPKESTELKTFLLCF